MKQRNTVIYRGFTDLGVVAAAAFGLLLGGCGQAVKRPQAAGPTPKNEVVTGIPACDSYLASYLACHRAAGTFPQEALQTHYQAMRDTLLQEANDPGVRPYLANRCVGLAQQLRDTLQGHACTSPDATSR
ncbi:hypothetical protein [Dyella choica]|uniref:Lipoprotein n=1 Tax=Dyella choica TaxID=1927959 RepID=A0A3S0WSR6_9GAMM|nr:hypothetical protein [Dyella choica]RUL69603.1 hypothetical protein EKH80_22000 [Dyella choica]